MNQLPKYNFKYCIKSLSFNINLKNSDEYKIRKLYKSLSEFKIIFKYICRKYNFYAIQFYFKFNLNMIKIFNIL